MRDIVLRNIQKRFGARVLFEGFDHTFPGSGITCILGASGGGKTTLLRMLAGLDTPDGGTIEGVPERIAFVFQEDRLCEDFSALSNLRLVGVSKAVAMEHLAELGLGEDAKKPLRSFSGGMKRRVAIARAMCFDADCILLDEPFKGLDETLKRTVMDYILRHGLGKTILCVTHDPAEAEYLGGERLYL